MSRYLCLVDPPHQKSHKYQCEKQRVPLRALRALIGLAGYDPCLPATTLPMGSGAPLQLRPGSGHYETRKSHEAQLSKAMAGPHKAPHGSSELHVSWVLTQARLQVLLCLAMHLNYPLNSWLTPLTSVTCSARLAWGQDSCTLPAPVAQRHFQRYSPARGFTAVGSSCRLR